MCGFLYTFSGFSGEGGGCDLFGRLIELFVKFSEVDVSHGFSLVFHFVWLSVLVESRVL